MSIEEGVILDFLREEVAAGLSERAARKPTIINKTMTDADTEYEISLPPKTKKFTMHMRETDTAFRLAYEKGRVAESKEEYFTVPIGEPYWEDELALDKKFSLYVACAVAAKTIEVIAWR